jgi:hypothetical protein
LASFIKYLKMLRGQSERFPECSILPMLKYYRRWSDSVEGVSNNELPWIAFSAIDFLKEHAGPEMRVFEYGSGSSTLFWSRRVKEVYSVEHDADWAKKVKQGISEKAIKNVELFQVLPQKRNVSKEIDIADPYQYTTDDEALKEYSFEDYVKKINEFPDKSFDFVIVDGRARPSCIVASIEKLKAGGYLVLDNSEREYYLSKTAKLLPSNEWKRLNFCGPIPGSFHFSQTTIFKKLS